MHYGPLCLSRSKISLLELELNPKLHQSCGCQVPALYHRQLKMELRAVNNPVTWETNYSLSP